MHGHGALGRCLLSRCRLLLAQDTGDCNLALLQRMLGLRKGECVRSKLRRHHLLEHPIKFVAGGGELPGGRGERPGREIDVREIRGHRELEVLEATDAWIGHIAPQVIQSFCRYSIILPSAKKP